LEPPTSSDRRDGCQHPTLSPDTRAAALRALRDKQRIDAEAARRRIMNEEAAAARQRRKRDRDKPKPK
jgi:hypothetical protein